MATVRISSDVGHPGKAEWRGAPRISASRKIDRTIPLPEEAFTKIEQGITDGCCEGIISLSDHSRVWWFLDGHVDPPGTRRPRTVAEEREANRVIAPAVQMDFATSASGKIEHRDAADTGEWQVSEANDK